MKFISSITLFTYLLYLIQLINCEDKLGPGGVKIEINGTLHSFYTDDCTGGIFFKKPITTSLICLNGYFLKRPMACSHTSTEIIASTQYGCIEYPQKTQVQLLVALTNSNFPTEHSIAFFEDLDLLTKFRSYNIMMGVQGKYLKNGLKNTASRFAIISSTHKIQPVKLGPVCYGGINDEENKAYFVDLGERDYLVENNFFERGCKNTSVDLDFEKAKSYSFTNSAPQVFEEEILANPSIKPIIPLVVETSNYSPFKNSNEKNQNGPNDESGYDFKIKNTDIFLPVEQVVVEENEKDDFNFDKRDFNFKFKDSDFDFNFDSGFFKSNDKSPNENNNEYFPPNDKNENLEVETIVTPSTTTTTSKPVKKITKLKDNVQWATPRYFDPMVEANIKISQFKLKKLSGQGNTENNPLDDAPSEASKWYKILRAAKEVTKKIIPQNSIPQNFFDDTFTIFGYFFRSIIDNADLLDNDCDKIVETLKKCAENPYENNLNSSFRPLKDLNITYASCPPQFIKVRLYDASGIEEDNFLIGKPNDKNKYHPQSNDPIVETMWNLIDISFAICAPKFSNNFNLAQKMMVYMQELVFLNPLVQDRWYHSVNSYKDYQAFLPAVNLVRTMRNIDKLKAIVQIQLLKSSFGNWFNKPRLLNDVKKTKLNYFINKIKKHHDRGPFSAFKPLDFKKRTSNSHPIRYRRSAIKEDESENIENFYDEVSESEIDFNSNPDTNNLILKENKSNHFEIQKNEYDELRDNQSSIITYNFPKNENDTIENDEIYNEENYYDYVEISSEKFENDNEKNKIFDSINQYNLENIELNRNESENFYQNQSQSQEDYFESNLDLDETGQSIFISNNEQLNKRDINSYSVLEKNSNENSDPISNSRKTLLEAQDGEAYEIWDGAAYCLQNIEEVINDKIILNCGFKPSLLELKNNNYC